MFSEALFRSGVVSVLASLVTNLWTHKTLRLDPVQLLATGTVIDYATDMLIPLIPMVIPLGGDLRRIAVGLVLSYVITKMMPLIPGSEFPSQTMQFTAALPIVNYFYSKTPKLW